MASLQTEVTQQFRYEALDMIAADQANGVHPSLIQTETALVRLTVAVVFLNNRRLSRHGMHGSLVALPLRDALRLVDAGMAKLPAGVRRNALRDAVASESLQQSLKCRPSSVRP